MFSCALTPLQLVHVHLLGPSSTSLVKTGLVALEWWPCCSVMLGLGFCKKCCIMVGCCLVLVVLMCVGRCRRRSSWLSCLGGVLVDWCSGSRSRCLSLFMSYGILLLYLRLGLVVSCLWILILMSFRFFLLGCAYLVLYGLRFLWRCIIFLS